MDTTENSVLHGNAICSVDCLMRNKNAILPLITFTGLQSHPDQCTDFRHGSNVCYVALVEAALYGEQGPRAQTCFPNEFTNIQAGNWLARLRIYDVTWSPASRNLSNNLADLDTSTTYNPVTGTGLYGGSMYEETQAAIDWRKSVGGPDRTDFINQILVECSIARNQAAQQSILDNCRQVYETALTTTLVGYTGPLPIPVIPTDNDRIPVMEQSCQYVYDVSNNIGCPLIDDMCSSSGMRGDWRFGLASPFTDPVTRMNLLPRHLCQNFVRPGSWTGNPWVEGPAGPATPDPNNQYFGGLGRQPDLNYLIPSTEPQSSSALVYRSCALQRFTATPEFCCANDFADGDGNVVFNPLPVQFPTVADILPGVHKTPLIGYDYDSTGTPWYSSCFDRNGLTCDIAVRDITGIACTRFMLPHCATEPETSAPESWDVTANDGSCECSRWLGRLLYGPGGQWINFLTTVANRGILRDRTATKLSSEFLSEITANFHKVFTMKTIFDGLLDSNPLAAAMEPVIFTLYSSYDLPLYDEGVILNQCGIYTIDDVVKNPMLRRWCGCMLNPSSYQARYPGVAIACTPTCNSIDVLQYGAPCEGTLCVLDGITLALINSTSTGGVSIVQVCQSCGQISSSDTSTIKQTCDCQIDDIYVTAIDSSLGTITIKEMCGQSGNGGKPVPSADGDATQRIIKATGTVIRTFPYPAVALLVAVCILSLICYIISRGLKTGRAFLWARGLAIGCLVLAILIVLFIAYSITVLSIP